MNYEMKYIKYKKKYLFLKSSVENYLGGSKKQSKEEKEAEKAKAAEERRLNSRTPAQKKADSEREKLEALSRVEEAEEARAKEKADMVLELYKHIKEALHYTHLSRVGGINPERYSEYALAKTNLDLDIRIKKYKAPKNIFYDDIVQINDPVRRHIIRDTIRGSPQQTQHSKERVDERGIGRTSELQMTDTTANLVNIEIPLYHIINLENIKNKKLKIIESSKDGKHFELDSFKFTLYQYRDRDRDTIRIRLLDEFTNKNYDISRFTSDNIKSKLFNILSTEDVGYECDVLVNFHHNKTKEKNDVYFIIPLLYDPREIADLIYDNITHIYLVHSDYYIISSDEQRLITYIKLS
jgi:hypothetical protein